MLQLPENLKKWLYRRVMGKKDANRIANSDSVDLDQTAPSRSRYRFTVCIENRYLRIDICIKSNMSISKKVSISNVNGQTLYISTENPLASSEIAIILG